MKPVLIDTYACTPKIILKSKLYTILIMNLCQYIDNPLISDAFKLTLKKNKSNIALAKGVCLRFSKRAPESGV